MLFQWLVPALALAMCLLISWLASRSNRTMRETGSERVLDDRGLGDPVSDEDVQEPRAAERPAPKDERDRQPVA